MAGDGARARRIPTALRARWIFPGDRPPLERATLLVEGGRVAEITTRHVPGAVDLGHAAVIPALINAHVHLEFSGLASPLAPAQPFADWIRALLAWRRRIGPSAAEPIAAGLSEAVAEGTGTLGEIATENWSGERLPDVPATIVLFRELIGMSPERRRQQLEVARRHLSEPREPSVPEAVTIVRGLSPHAPYSAHPDLVAGAVALARACGAPVAMHLAETREELELLASGTGALAELLRELGAWFPEEFARRRTPRDDLELLAAAPRALVVHGNYLVADDLDFLARQPQMSLVYCPRTHARFGHAPHPWRDALARGVNVAVGTDGRGSNPDLSVWRELQFLRRIAPDLPGDELLALGTRRGAWALGVESAAGALAPGRVAETAVVRLPDRQGDPWELLFAGKIEDRHAAAER